MQNVFSEIVDISVTGLEYALKLYWNAAKYAKKIKCRLGVQNLEITASPPICPKMTAISATEWKTILHKVSYFDSDSARKISLNDEIPVTVKLYLTQEFVNAPRLVSILSPDERLRP